ncbi:MAG: DUF6807 family protein [Rubripirellula sp.]
MRNRRTIQNTVHPNLGRGRRFLITALVFAACCIAGPGPVAADEPTLESPRPKIEASEPHDQNSKLEPGLTAEQSGDGVLVREHDRPVLFYQRSPKSLNGKWRRSGYLHPVHDLEGRVITEDFPEDHRHHRGIFWAWHQVWVGDQRIGDPWLCQDFDWEVQSISTNASATPLIIDAHVHWKSKQWTDSAGESLPIVDERTRIIVHRQSEHSRCIDFDISLLAVAENVRIGGSEDEKGYGGFSPRIQMTPAREFRFPSETVKPIKTAVRGGPWVDMSNEQNGIAIMSHPENPSLDTGQPWILRKGRSMQNAVYPGRDPVTLDKDVPTRLRYRLVIHDGVRSGTELQKLYDEYVVSGG